MEMRCPDCEWTGDAPEDDPVCTATTCYTEACGGRLVPWSLLDQLQYIADGSYNLTVSIRQIARDAKARIRELEAELARRPL